MGYTVLILVCGSIGHLIEMLTMWEIQTQVAFHQSAETGQSSSQRLQAKGHSLLNPPEYL